MNSGMGVYLVTISYVSQTVVVTDITGRKHILLKMYVLPYKIEGFYYNPQWNNSNTNPHILLNEILTSRGNFVPEEICLLEGYKYLNDLGLCGQNAGRINKKRKRSTKRNKDKYI